MVEKLVVVHPLLGVDHQHFLDEVLGQGADLFGEGDYFLVGFLDLSLGELHFLEEGVFAEEHLVGDDPEAPNIALFVIFLIVKNLGGHGDIRADSGGEILLILKFSEPKISQLNLKILGNQNVF